ncbi:hypothetical protein P9H32_12490 [Pontiella sp. NLcol2]|uniref:Lipoprotein n=2 Tax=Pontiella agarivorans TaxID=3038953 RepID=A0ABU5MZ19_9BACT|nr:hypothetical protein [Pontiella agarivorans]
MKTFLKITSLAVSGALLAGCASINGADGPHGPELVSRGYATDRGSYAEVGVSFSTAGDFFAVVNPNRWKNPIKTGGSLSWVNPVAWSDDAGRTGRILLGEAVVVGGVAAVAAGGGGGGGGSSTPYGPGESPDEPGGGGRPTSK